VKQDTREKLDQDREKEENDIAGCDEVVVPHYNLCIAPSKGYCDGDCEEGVCFGNSHQNETCHCWFAKGCRGRGKSDQAYERHLAYVREKRPGQGIKREIVKGLAVRACGNNIVTETRVKCAGIKRCKALEKTFKLWVEVMFPQQKGANGIGGGVDRDAEG